MDKHQELPRLRTDLEYLWTIYEGQDALVVKDPVGLIKKPLVFFGETLDFLRLLQGSSTKEELQLQWVRMKQGVFISQAEIQKMIDDLDQLCLLDTPRYRLQKEEVIKKFSSLSVRPPALAGQSYPEKKEELISFLRKIIDKKDSPSPAEKTWPMALVVPHIDLEVGGRVYAAGYKFLPPEIPPLIFLLGTGHHLSDGLVSLTFKDFETPLGRVKTAKEVVQELIADDRTVISPDDFAHRSEHSLEFPLLFLQYFYGLSFTIVPILVGSFHNYLLSQMKFEDIPGLLTWIKKVKEIVEQHRQKCLIIASVDLAHVGLKFGHSLPGEELVPEARIHDEKLIEALVRGDVREFWRANQAVQDKYNVCGFSTLTVLLGVLSGCQGRLIDYQFWLDSSTRSAVSFAALAFFEEETKSK